MSLPRKFRDLLAFRQYATFAREPFFALAREHYRPGMRILDIGAGNGEFARYLGDPRIHLIEGNPQSAEALRQEFPNAVCHRIPEPLPYEEGFFDLIHCSHLIEHLQPAELYALMVEMNRCLKTGGILVVSAPMLWSGFFNDLSHVRPYNPEIFYSYLCRSHTANRTRQTISGDYQVLRLQYRYYLEPLPYRHACYSRTSLGHWWYALINAYRRCWLANYTVSGYTLVLEKRPSLVSTAAPGALAAVPD